MSDYMFMLENHLTTAQAQIVADLQAAAASASVNLFLTGGSIRDMFGGFPIRELAFTVEGPALQLAKKIAETSRAEIRQLNEVRKTAEIAFPNGVVAELGMSRNERYAKPGGKPQVSPATIHEHLQQRDFTINALALSLNKASRGLLIDPTNGLSDLQQRELRTVSNRALFDRPARLMKLLRLKVRLGFELSTRTQSQYENAREAGIERSIPAVDLFTELRHAAGEAHVAEVLQLWQQEGFLSLVSPALTSEKLNLPNFIKYQKALQAMPFGLNIRSDEVAIFFSLLTEALNAKERAALVERFGIDKGVSDSWFKLDARAAKLEKELAAPSLNKPSLVYRALTKVPGELPILLLVKSGQRTVGDRLRNYFSKYLPMAQEVTDKEVIEAGGKIGTSKFETLKGDLIRKKLDARPKKVEPPPEPPPPPPGPPGRPMRPGQPSVTPRP